MKKPDLKEVIIKHSTMWAVLVAVLFLGVALGYWWRMSQMSDQIIEMKKAQAQIVQSLTDCEQVLREKEQ